MGGGGMWGGYAPGAGMGRGYGENGRRGYPDMGPVLGVGNSGMGAFSSGGHEAGRNLYGHITRNRALPKVGRGAGASASASAGTARGVLPPPPSSLPLEIDLTSEPIDGERNSSVPQYEDGGDQNGEQEWENDFGFQEEYDEQDMDRLERERGE